MLLAIIAGIVLGATAPDLAASFKPLGDAFVRLIKMIMPLLSFVTVVVGIAKMGDMKELGRVGLKALLYFEVVTTVALGIGISAVNLVQPGAGMNIDPARLNTSSLLTFEKAAPHQTTADFLLNIIPSSAVDAFAKDDMLQVLLFSVLFGVGLSFVGGTGRPVLDFIDRVSRVLFAIVGVLVRLAPLGAFGAMAFAVAKFGLNSFWSLASLMLVIYGSSALFIVVVLGGICWLSGFSLWKHLFYLKEEIFIVLATTSSEAALQTLIRKLEHAGCAEQCGRAGYPDGLLLQSGWDVPVPGDLRYVHRPGDGDASRSGQPDHADGRIHVDVQRFGRRSRG